MKSISGTSKQSINSEKDSKSCESFSSNDNPEYNFDTRDFDQQVIQNYNELESFNYLNLNQRSFKVSFYDFKY